MNLLRTFGLVIVLALYLPAQDTGKKVSKTEALQAAVSKVQPEYPQIAKQLKIEGMVELEATVAENGTVEKVNIVSGNPILTRPAADALKRWRFRPFTDGGKAVKAIAPIDIAFKRD